MSMSHSEANTTRRPDLEEGAGAANSAAAKVGTYIYMHLCYFFFVLFLVFISLTHVLFLPIFPALSTTHAHRSTSTLTTFTTTLAS